MIVDGECTVQQMYVEALVMAQWSCERAVKTKLTAQHFEVNVEVNYSLQNSNLCSARRRSENPSWNDQGYYM